MVVRGRCCGRKDEHRNASPGRAADFNGCRDASCGGSERLDDAAVEAHAVVRGADAAGSVLLRAPQRHDGVGQTQHGASQLDRQRAAAAGRTGIECASAAMTLRLSDYGSFARNARRSGIAAWSIV